MFCFNGQLARNHIAMLNDRQCHMKLGVAGDFWPNHFFGTASATQQFTIDCDFDSNAYINTVPIDIIYAPNEHTRERNDEVICRHRLATALVTIHRQWVING